jgi:hypothetical protein
VNFDIATNNQTTKPPNHLDVVVCVGLCWFVVDCVGLCWFVVDVNVFLKAQLL